MRSHDGYRALVVFATVLVYMHGTLAVRIAGSASRRNGESSSLLWFSRASFRLALPYLRLSCRSLPLSAIYVRYCSFSAANRPLPPDGHARALLAAPPSSYHLLLPLSSSSFSSSSSSRKQHAVKFIPLVESLILLYLSFCQGIRYVHLFYSCSFLFLFSPSLSLFFFTLSSFLHEKM